MTVTGRRGRRTAAASGFRSSIIREPLNGQEAVCPVPTNTLVALASPERTIAGLIVAAEATADAWGSRTAGNLPALTVQGGEMLDSPEIAAGRATRDPVRFHQDPTISR